MKKTIYFTSTSSLPVQNLTTAIKEATDKRDLWLNKHEIGKIDNEDIKITTWNSNNSYVMVTILLTYYNK